jgi:hypothetical protein
MKLLCSCSLALGCCFAHGQIDDASALFSPSPLQLRQIPSLETTTPSAFTPPAFELQAAAAPNTSPADLFFAGKEGNPAEPQLDQFELDSFSSTESRRIYARLDNEGFFERPLARSDNLIDRTIDTIFVPEPIKLGKMTLSCSVYNAVKRRNPLCLINPIFFNLSW